MVSLSLQGLTHMSVSGNCLELLPVEVGELSNLLELNLEGNALKRSAPLGGVPWSQLMTPFPLLSDCPPLLVGWQS